MGQHQGHGLGTSARFADIVDGHPVNGHPVMAEIINPRLGGAPVEGVGPAVGKFPQIGAVEAVGPVLVTHVRGPTGAANAIPKVRKGMVGHLHGEKFGLHNDSMDSGVIIDTLISRRGRAPHPKNRGL